MTGWNSRLHAWRVPETSPRQNLLRCPPTRPLKPQASQDSRHGDVGRDQEPRRQHASAGVNLSHVGDDGHCDEGRNASRPENSCAHTPHTKVDSAQGVCISGVSPKRKTKSLFRHDSFINDLAEMQVPGQVARHSKTNQAQRMSKELSFQFIQLATTPRLFDSSKQHVHELEIAPSSKSLPLRGLQGSRCLNQPGSYWRCKAALRELTQLVAPSIVDSNQGAQARHFPLLSCHSLPPISRNEEHVDVGRVRPR